MLLSIFYGLVQWSHPLKKFDGDILDEPYGNYIGEEMFDVSLDYLDNDHMIFNGNTGKAFYLYVGYSSYNDYKEYVSFEFGKDYFIARENNCAYVSDKPLIYDNTFIAGYEAYATTGCFALNPDGSWSKISSESPLASGFTQKGSKWINLENEYMEIYDPKTDYLCVFDDYPSSMIDTTFTHFNDSNIGTVAINGQDNKSYFTIIDKDGNMKFKPIEGDVPSYSSGKITYKNGFDKYNLIDENGNIIAENLEFEYIRSFQGDIASARISEDRECYINSKGEVILDKIVIPKN